MMPAITGTANERHVFLNAVNDSLLSGVAAHAPVTAYHSTVLVRGSDALACSINSARCESVSSVLALDPGRCMRS